MSLRTDKFALVSQPVDTFELVRETSTHMVINNSSLMRCRVCIALLPPKSTIVANDCCRYVNVLLSCGPTVWRLPFSIVSSETVI